MPITEEYIKNKLAELRNEYRTATPAMKNYIIARANLLKKLKVDPEVNKTAKNVQT